MATKKFGISMDEELLERVEEPLEFGDRRSERICDLVDLGLAVEEAAESMHVQIPANDRERRAFLRQVFIDADV